jgi:transposase
LSSKAAFPLIPSRSSPKSCFSLERATSAEARTELVEETAHRHRQQRGASRGSRPSFAPELNPAEYVWAQADQALANGAPDDLADLRQGLDTATRRPRRSQHLLGSCIFEAEVAVAPGL